MTINRAGFFAAIRRPLFGGRLQAGQVAGIEAILDRAEGRALPCDPRHLAYMLATTHHETGRRMQPVRETGAAGDAEAIAKLDAAFRRGQLPSVSSPYWRTDESGRSWFGRGLVQLTHKRNYERLSTLTGVDLVSDPARAMEPDVAVTILFIGMETGAFTGRALHHYFTPERSDWTGARRIINGLDRAGEIAALARSYHAALTATAIAPRTSPPDVSSEGTNRP